MTTPSNAWKLSHQEQDRWNAAMKKLPLGIQSYLKQDLIHGNVLEFERIVKVSEACAKEAGGCNDCLLTEICKLGWDLRVRDTGKLREYVETMRELRRRLPKA